jgi:hypothetical protein
MHVLAQVSSVLATLPASPAHPGTNAGMTFTMLRSIDPLFAGPSERQLTNERLAELARGARRLSAIAPQFAALEAQLSKIQQSLSK